MLLTDQNLKTLAVRYDIDELRYLKRGEQETVIRPEDFEDAILNVRKAIAAANDAGYDGDRSAGNDWHPVDNVDNGESWTENTWFRAHGKLLKRNLGLGIIARRGGRFAPASTTGSSENVTGSFGLTSNGVLPIDRAGPNASSRPITNPDPTGVSAGSRIIRTTSQGQAPSGCVAGTHQG